MKNQTVEKQSHDIEIPRQKHQDTENPRLKYQMK